MKTVQDKFKTSLKSLDLLHVPINLCLKNEPFVKTNIGAILSIILILLIFIFGWLIGKDIIFNERPYSFQQNSILESFSKINLNRTSFPLAISILDLETTPLDIKGYLTLYIKISNSKADKDGMLKKEEDSYLHLKNCEYLDFPQIDKNHFNDLKLKNYFCPNNYNEEIYGFWSTPELRYLEIYLSVCNQEQEANIKCKDKSEIESFLLENTVSINLYFIDPVISINNYSQPISNIIKKSSVIAQPGKFKLQKFFLQKDSLETDKGIFTESLKYDYFFQVKEEYLDSTVYDDKLKTLVNFKIFSSNKHTLTKRRYVKCTEILANIGGIYKLLYSILYSINFYFADLEKDIMIIDSIDSIANIENSSNKKNEKIDFNSSKLQLNNINLNNSSKICHLSSFNTQILKMTTGNKILVDDPNFKKFNDKFLSFIKEEGEINTNARNRKYSPSSKLTPVKSKRFESQTNSPRNMSEQKNYNTNNDSPSKLNENISKNLYQTPANNNKIFSHINFNNFKDDFIIPYSSKSSKNNLCFNYTNVSIIEKIKIIIYDLFNYRSSKDEKINKYLRKKIEIKSRLDVINIIFQLNELEKIKSLVM